MSNKPCTKGTCTVTWAVLECMFFAGVVFGWSWLMVVFRSDKYFVDLCNTTGFILDNREAEHFQTTISTPVKKKSCRPRNRGRRNSDVTSEIQVYTSFDSYPQHDPTVPLYDVTTISDNPISSGIHFSGCVEQTNQLRLLFALVIIIRDALVLPIGIFFDQYGTTRTRLLTVLIFALGTLMMTFTGAGYPWLIVPALSLTGVAGMAVLVTNLQIANLFARRRHTVISSCAGATVSSALIAFLMHLSHFIGVNVQTSFMFLTIGIVPLLVSTIAFLPKTKIPWPLPLDYGKRRNQSLDETMLRKQRAWQRRMSGRIILEAGMSRIRRPVPEFSPLIVQSLYIWAVVWYGVHHLQIALFETKLIELTGPDRSDHIDYEQLYGSVQIFGVVVSPLAGMWIDKYRRRELGVPAGTQQMQNILPVMFTTSVLSVLELVMSMVTGSVAARIASFFLNLLHRVFLLTSSCAFLMHVHFPQQHFGKLFGLMMAVSAILGAFQFPMKNFLITRYSNTLQVNIIMLCLSIISIGHPLNVWNHCRKRLIRDQPIKVDERPKREASTTNLTAHPDVDDINLHTGNRDAERGLGKPEHEVRDTNGDVIVAYDERDDQNEEFKDTDI